MSILLKKLIQQFQFLPGIGEKTAQRFTYHIFGRDKQRAKQFALTLLEAIDNIKYCQRCRNLTETTLCAICKNPNRHDKQICVVEYPSNISVIESSQSFNGKYFVLHGVLSPIDGIGPKDLGIQQLYQLVKDLHIQEVIIATSSRIEGEATAYYIDDQIGGMTKISRLAHGIPIGGSLDYIDGQTIAKALQGRNLLQESEDCEDTSNEV